jgi:hypothetical protein
MAMRVHDRRVEERLRTERDATSADRWERSGRSRIEVTHTPSGRAWSI